MRSFWHLNLLPFLPEIWIRHFYHHIFCFLATESPHPEPEPQDQRVVVTEVTPQKNVKAKEKGTADVTFDVSVDVDPATTSDVQGSNLWVLTVFASKLKNGKGPRVAEISQALSRAQQSQRIQNGRRLAFRVRILDNKGKNVSHMSKKTIGCF